MASAAHLRSSIQTISWRHEELHVEGIGNGYQRCQCRILVLQREQAPHGRGGQVGPSRYFCLRKAKLFQPDVQRADNVVEHGDVAGRLFISRHVVGISVVASEVLFSRSSGLHRVSVTFKVQYPP